MRTGGRELVEIAVDYAEVESGAFGKARATAHVEVVARLTLPLPVAGAEDVGLAQLRGCWGTPRLGVADLLGRLPRCGY